MAISEIDIVNRALQRIGAQRIDAFDQSHPNARSALAAYESVRDRLLRAHPWNFAVKRARLPALSDKTEFGELYRYELPDDFLRLLPPDDRARRDWRIEGREITTADAPPLDVRYIARVTDPNLYDASFVEVLASRLALELAYEIAPSQNIVQLTSALYEAALREAKSVGAFEEPPQEPPEDDWITIMRT
jgi:hypothetical protein